MMESYKLTREQVHSGRYEVVNTASGEIGSARGEHSLNLEIAHRAAIQRVLRKGLIVPDEVLADYPDLQVLATANQLTGKGLEG